MVAGWLKLAYHWTLLNKYAIVLPLFAVESETS